jgi:hypothetical protein
MYHKNEIVKLKNSNSIFTILDYETILDVTIYYLNGGISVAEHQIERVASIKEKVEVVSKTASKHILENSKKINLMFAENLNKMVSECKPQNEKKLSLIKRIKNKIFG